jgi:hypothetical protein
MNIDIDNLTEDQLIALNLRVVERLKELHSQHIHREMMQFDVGESVCFKPPGRHRQTGTLVRFNKKTVTVITEGGQRWNVSPNLLSRVRDCEPINDDAPLRAWQDHSNVVMLRSSLGKNR